MLAVAVTMAPWTAPPATALAPCPPDQGVTVVVDGSVLGAGVRTSCASGSPSSGLEALVVAGFDYTEVQSMSGFVCRIDGLPGPEAEDCLDVPPGSAYWSYWTADLGGDWRYSTLGPGRPPQGSVEGWRFGSGDAPPAAPVPAAPTTTSTTTTSTTTTSTTTTTTTVPTTVTTAPPAPASTAAPAATTPDPATTGPSPTTTTSTSTSTTTTSTTTTTMPAPTTTTPTTTIASTATSAGPVLAAEADGAGADPGPGVPVGPVAGVAAIAIVAGAAVIVGRRSRGSEGP